MTRTLALIAAMTFTAGTASAALLAEGLTPLDPNETFSEETMEFVGNGFYDANDVFLGRVVKAQSLPGEERRIFIKFDESFTTDYAGMLFEIDGMWETSGVLKSTDTAAEILMTLDTIAMTDETAVKDAEVLE